MVGESPVCVLIVDDDVLVLEALRHLLERRHYRVVGQAVSGEQAIELAQAFRPDVILLDVEMPGMNGVETAWRIQNQCPAPVVFLTAYETDQLVDEASEVGAGAYLLKPPNASEIDRAITISRARFGDLVKLRRLNAELQAALAQVKTLRGLLPICASCKKIRDDAGYWHGVETYVSQHTDAVFSHGICPDCFKKLYPDFVDDRDVQSG